MDIPLNIPQIVTDEAARRRQALRYAAELLARAKEENLETIATYGKTPSPTRAQSVAFFSAMIDERRWLKGYEGDADILKQHHMLDAFENTIAMAVHEARLAVERWADGEGPLPPPPV